MNVSKVPVRQIGVWVYGLAPEVDGVAQLIVSPPAKCWQEADLFIAQNVRIRQQTQEDLNLQYMVVWDDEDERGAEVQILDMSAWEPGTLRDYIVSEENQNIENAERHGLKPDGAFDPEETRIFLLTHDFEDT